MLLCFAVFKCAVSSSGDKLYITNKSQHKLLTLGRDGSVLAIFTDPALQGQRGVHVTPAGQMLFCGGLYPNYSILQVDSEGRGVLATLATQAEGVVRPWLVGLQRVPEISDNIGSNFRFAGTDPPLKIRFRIFIFIVVCNLALFSQELFFIQTGSF
ncbi:hypothetical protein DPMN_183985 [Dreissena polymorpha]|uniref:Uncharacterized protein n=1 Tax=Dreissena polymorpha TaxID=45954 RepID=A0A9D4I7G5_DREPO|nr:hypothetical protein DPMN_183985 [Dreissena polymorpha]